MGKINLLSQETIDKIAAGEVVERPASVAKELIENSIDAGASAISVEIKGGGIEYLRISDNGSGIEKDQIQLAFMRQSTSKIQTAADLASVRSLGFRGEALSSISAVSKVELITKTKDSLLGASYIIEGAKELSLSDIGAPDGTTFIVRQLFYNTPARKKFLKSESTEGSYVFDVVEHLALSHPEISFKFLLNGKEKPMTSGNGSLSDTIYQIYGRQIASNVLDIDYQDDKVKIDDAGNYHRPLFLEACLSGDMRNTHDCHHIPVDVVERSVDRQEAVAGHAFRAYIAHEALLGDGPEGGVVHARAEYGMVVELRLGRGNQQAVGVVEIYLVARVAGDGLHGLLHLRGVDVSVAQRILAVVRQGGLHNLYVAHHIALVYALVAVYGEPYRAHAHAAQRKEGGEQHQERYAPLVGISRHGENLALPQARCGRNDNQPEEQKQVGEEHQVRQEAPYRTADDDNVVVGDLVDELHRLAAPPHVIAGLVALRRDSGRERCAPGVGYKPAGRILGVGIESRQLHVGRLPEQYVGHAGLPVRSHAGRNLQIEVCGLQSVEIHIGEHAQIGSLAAEVVHEEKARPRRKLYAVF